MGEKVVYSKRSALEKWHPVVRMAMRPIANELTAGAVTQGQAWTEELLKNPVYGKVISGLQKRKRFDHLCYCKECCTTLEHSSQLASQCRTNWEGLS